jgi:hypothetical protein
MEFLMPAAQTERPEREHLACDTEPDLVGYSEAVFNEARTHRYLLVRRWGDGGRTATFIMLNPSTATAMDDDPTIRRCVGYAKREGCSALTVVNLFGLRATHPVELRRHWDPVGERNDEFIDQQCLAKDDGPPRLVVAAWGGHGHYLDRSQIVGDRLHDQLTLQTGRRIPLLCLGTTRTGQPRHPLYLTRNEPLIPYVP